MRDDIEPAESTLSSTPSAPDTDPEKKDQTHAELSETELEAGGNDADKAEARENGHGPLEKTLSRKSKHSVNSIATVPNGGLLAWLQVLGAFFLFFNSWCVCPPGGLPGWGSIYLG